MLFSFASVNLNAYTYKLMLGAPLLYVAKASTTLIDVVFPIIICVFLFANAFAVAPVKYVYVSEVFPAALKPNAVQIILFSEIVTSIISSYSLYLVSELGLSISFTIMSGIGFVGVGIVYLLAIETLNKSFEEIDHTFVLSKHTKYFPACSACCTSSVQIHDDV